MAPHISYPGVYIEEIPSGMKKIRFVPTSITGIVGSFVKGPLNVAKRVKSWKECTHIFGELNKKHLASYSVKQFFDNGGTTLWVVRTQPQISPTAPALIQGVHALAKVQSLNIVVIPETHQLETRAASIVYREAISLAEQHQAMYILDPPYQGRNSMPSAKMTSWVARQKTLGHSQVVIYTPSVQVRDPRTAKHTTRIPASGTIAGLWARIDHTRGVWKAPAGTEATLRKVQSLERQMTTQEMEGLTNKNINALRRLPSTNIVTWGSRTLSSDPEWKYIPVRRMALFIESSVQRGTQWVVFEPNNEALWANIRQSVENFLQGLFRKGAFAGSKPAEAYFVKCGHDTMSANDRRIGKVNIIIGFAPLKPAEFMILTIQQEAQALGKS